MFLRYVTMLAVLCAFTFHSSSAHAEGFWELQTLDDADEARVSADYMAPQYNADRHAVPRHAFPQSELPRHDPTHQDVGRYDMPAFNTPISPGTTYVYPMYDRPAYESPTYVPSASTTPVVVVPRPTSPADLWAAMEAAPTAPVHRVADAYAYDQSLPPAPTSLTYQAQEALTNPSVDFPPPGNIPPVTPVMPSSIPAVPPATPPMSPAMPPPPTPTMPSVEQPPLSSLCGDAGGELDGQALADAFYGTGSCDLNPAGVAWRPPFVRASCWGPPVARKLGRFYGGVEYLHWWVRGQRLPVLVTSSPAGTPDFEAGVWGLPATEVLYGGNRTDADDSPGGRFYLGMNLDCEGCNQVEAEYFVLGRGSFNYAVTSPDDYTIIARPFYNTFAGQEDSELVGYPGTVDGTVSVRSRTNFDGLGIWLRHNLLNFHPQCAMSSCGTANCDSCGSDDAWSSYGQRNAAVGCGRPARRLDLIMGYRRLDLDESLFVNEYLTSTDPGGAIALGTTLDIEDRFHTENEFHGGDVGLDWEWSQGCWGVGALFKCALGNVRQRVCVNGSTTVTPPAGAAVDSAGGILALDSNSGNYERDEFTVIPEVGFDAFYQLNCHVRLKVGYTLIYFSNVLRPGDLIDRNVDPQQLPPPLIINGRFPERRLYEDDFWAQGLRLGAEVTF